MKAKKKKLYKKLFTGEVWPKPFQQTFGSQYSIVRPNELKFTVSKSKIQVIIIASY